MNSKSSIKKSEFPWGVEISQFIFLLLAIIYSCCFAFGIFVIIFGYEQFDSKFPLKIVILGIFTITYIVVFYGTYKIKNWVVTPVLVISAYGLISNLINIFTIQPTSILKLVQEASHILMAVFFLFQLYVYTRTETKRFFKEKGTTLVS